MKRFREAQPLFRQVLILEPRHTGAAYLLSLALYFSGAFADAVSLFDQLLTPTSPLDSKQLKGMRELRDYAHKELLRQTYWEQLQLKNSAKISRELQKRHWSENSLFALHLHLANDKSPEWLENHELPGVPVDARILTRTNKTKILPRLADVDQAVGFHLEAIRGTVYQFIPFSEISALEYGPVKRWMEAQIEYQDGSRATVSTPLTYVHSMLESGRGIQEGIEALLKPLPGLTQFNRAFGQKQFRSVAEKISLAEILRLEFSRRGKE